MFLGGCTPPPTGGGVAADGKAWKEIVWCFTLLKEIGCVGALLGVWNSTSRFVCGVLFLAPCGVAGHDGGW